METASTPTETTTAPSSARSALIAAIEKHARRLLRLRLASPGQEQVLHETIEAEIRRTLDLRRRLERPSVEPDTRSITRKATACGHADLRHYPLGKCRSCYQDDRIFTHKEPAGLTARA